MAAAKNTICLWYDRDAEAAARFYAENTLPQALGLVAPVTSGAAGLFAIEPKYL